ncbi:terminase small subunit [Pseudomonas sp. S75]|uniref:terminase small subunit n=1 Tax=unclassified Pseudomonas TaxID=196821 RepID=UPI001902CE02|nr:MULTISPECIES: terminase small subunit [unclassified Pseudomonas]MBJ9975287.1 terminase small subunit [Pseudomonas sp. S30]MBK0152739.1 terminase small subunit [Pseudomonas sp. S75]
MTYLTKSEFAARRGWSKSYVSKLASQDRLVLSDDGKVDVEATEALLAESADPSKAAVAARHSENRVERDVRSHLQPSADTPAVQAVVQAPGKGRDFQAARAHREYYLAQLAEADFRKVQGQLVERQRVEDAAFTAARGLRDQMFGLAPQLAAELAGMTDPWDVEKHLTDTFRRVFTDAAKMNDDDLERAMKPS